MATLGQIFQSLEEQRKAAPQKSPLADSLNSLSKALFVMQKGIASLDDTIQEQRTAQGAARNLAQADDVKEKIRTLLELKVSEDKIERDRHQRMMEVAEGVVPQITDEQLETIREQRKAYREQQWALKEELRIAEETAKVQKESSKAIADAETAVIKDKYGTISSAVGGLESRAQDPLSRMLVQGLGRFVKGKEDDKAKVIAKAQADRDRIIDRDRTWNKEDIQEDAAIAAYRKGIKDPGTAVALLKQRDQKVAELAKTGESLEGGIATGNYNKGKTPKKPSSSNGTAVAETVPVAPATVVAAQPPKVSVPEALPVESPRPAPENARFVKRETQTTSPVTPNRQRPVGQSADRGMFGSKAGFADFGGIGKLVSGIVGPLKSLAGSFLKFMGPWGLVANALMSFDRIVPLISDGAGALMDLSKLIMPMGVTALIEGFGLLADLGNSLVNLIGTNLDKSDAVAASKKQYREKFDSENEASFKEWEKIRKANVGKKSTVKNTTSMGEYDEDLPPILNTVSWLERNDTRLTSPADKNRIDNQLLGQSYSMPTDTSSKQSQDDTIKEFKDALMAVAHNPGTTPVFVKNPSLDAWPT